MSEISLPSDELARIKLRPTNPHNDAPLRDNVAGLDGMEGPVRFLWWMDEDDGYPGEKAYQLVGDTWPEDAPTWIASGDLELLTPHDTKHR